MPLIVMKMYPGRSEEQKKTLAEALARAASDVIGVPVEKFSVALHEVDAEDWKVSVRDVDIAPHLGKFYKKSV